jgi:hypothetical protein
LGERMRKGQAKGFRHRMTLGFDKLAVTTLLSQMRPDALERQYTCCCPVGGDDAIPPGTSVTVLVNGAGLNILHGNHVVGCVEPEDLDALRAAVEIGGGILRAIVVEVSSFGGIFTIRLDEEEAQ